MGKGRKDVPINALVMGKTKGAHLTQNWEAIKIDNKIQSKPRQMQTLNHEF